MVPLPYDPVVEVAEEFLSDDQAVALEFWESCMEDVRPSGCSRALPAAPKPSIFLNDSFQA
jgi:hypothetical protein